MNGEPDGLSALVQAVALGHLSSEEAERCLAEAGTGGVVEYLLERGWLERGDLERMGPVWDGEAERRFEELAIAEGRIAAEQLARARDDLRERLPIGAPLWLALGRRGWLESEVLLDLLCRAGLSPRVCPVCRRLSTSSAGLECPTCAVPPVPIGPAELEGLLATRRRPRATVEAGARLGRYEIVREVGRGGMGVVFEARDVELGRRVALKLLDAPAARPEEIRRFRREAALAASLRHPGVVTVFDVGSEGARHWVVMEFVEGGTLAERLARSGPLAPLEAAGLLAPVARAIHHAHEKGIVHRDIKPSNVLLEDGRAKVSDFGLARPIVPAESLTPSGAAVGTPAYMAPEQVLGQASRIGAVTDVWALGVVLHECLAGRRPFAGESNARLYRAILEEEPSVSPRVSGDARAVVRACLEKDPARRYPSAGELAEDLERLAAGERVAAPRRLFRRLLGRGVRRAAAIALLAGVTLAGSFAGASAWKEARDARRRAERDAALAPYVDEAERRLLFLENWGSRDGDRARSREGYRRLVEETEALLVEANAAAPDTPEVELLFARSRLAAGALGPARDRLRALDEAMARLERAESLGGASARSEYVGARILLARLAELRPRPDLAWRIEPGRFAIVEDERDEPAGTEDLGHEAAARLEQALSGEGSRFLGGEARLARALLASLEGDYASALASIDEHVADPTGSFSWTARDLGAELAARVGLGLEDAPREAAFRRATEHLEALGEIRSWDRRFWTTSGFVAAAAGDLDRAIECYARAVELDPEALEPAISLAASYRLRAERSLALGDGDPAPDLGRAIDAANGALERHPASVTLRRLRGLSLASLGESIRTREGRLDRETWAAAVADLEGLGSRVGDLAALALATHRLAEAIAAAGEDARAPLARARSCYDQLAPLVPDDGQVAYGRAAVLLALARLEGSEDLLRQAAAAFESAAPLRPGDGKAWVGAAEVHRVLAARAAAAGRDPAGSLAAALDAYARAIESDRGLAVAYHNRGVLREGTGDPDGAESDYARALELGLEASGPALERLRARRPR